MSALNHIVVSSFNPKSRRLVHSDNWETMLEMKRTWFHLWKSYVFRVTTEQRLISQFHVSNIEKTMLPFTQLYHDWTERYPYSIVHWMENAKTVKEHRLHSETLCWQRWRFQERYAERKSVKREHDESRTRNFRIVCL